MDYSNHKDAKGSKVLKVALSAALAAAFTPMAAIPAFAVEGTGGGQRLCHRAKERSRVHL